MLGMWGGGGGGGGGRGGGVPVAHYNSPGRIKSHCTPPYGAFKYNKAHEFGLSAVCIIFLCSVIPFCRPGFSKCHN